MKATILDWNERFVSLGDEVVCVECCVEGIPMSVSEMGMMCKDV
jgi:hypothetical protein